MTRPPEIRIGLPYASDGQLCKAAQRLGPTLISAGSLYRSSRGGFQPVGWAAWRTRAALDSAGFVAMKKGGYQWSVSEYVDYVVTNGGDGTMPFPWEWWSSMDYCCEPEILADRAEVDRRVDLTVETYGEILECLEGWIYEGLHRGEVPDPLPILQGRTPADYLRCAEGLAAMAQKHDRDGLPELVGLGSVCRRELHGPEGLITILDAIHAALPAGVRLHLFGVKGDALRHLARYGDRIASIDSMAWDFRARADLNEQRAALQEAEGITYAEARKRLPSTVAHRAQHMAVWFETQTAKVLEAF